MNIIFMTGTAASGRTTFARQASTFEYFPGPVAVIEPKEQEEAEMGIRLAKATNVKTLLVVPNTGMMAGDAQLVLELSTRIRSLTGDPFF